MFKLKPIILLLAFALLIQNTCPHGYAGKTSVASTCNHCSLQQHRTAFTDPQEKISTGVTQLHFPMFVFAVPKTIHTFRLGPVQSGRPVLYDQYKDVLPSELLRPPQA